jgi:hypothetical protein
MKKFLFTTGVFMLVALLSLLASFLYIQSLVKPI